ncbi:MAG: DMT family transporter [Armatimonadetes bacterium]|nr:DMT family transporter [Armatimonadota bacterium]
MEQKTQLSPAGTKAKASLGIHFVLFLTVTIWASTFINIKVVLQQLPPNTIAFLRFFLAGIILVFYFRLTGQPGVKREDWPRVGVCGLTGVALYNFLQNQGLKYAGATDAAILASLAPVFMAVLSWLILHENITGQQIFGIIVAFTGSLLVATNGSFRDLAINSTRLWGDFLVLLTGVVWAVYNIALKKLLDRYPPVTVLTYSTVIGTLLLFPLMLFESPQFGSVNLAGWPQHHLPWLDGVRPGLPALE